METKYDLLSNRELINELKKRGLRPFEGGKRWNQKFLMKQRLAEDDKKKISARIDGSLLSGSCNNNASRDGRIITKQSEGHISIL